MVDHHKQVDQRSSYLLWSDMFNEGGTASNRPCLDDRGVFILNSMNGRMRLYVK